MTVLQFLTEVRGFLSEYRDFWKGFKNAIEVKIDLLAATQRRLRRELLRIQSEVTNFTTVLAELSQLDRSNNERTLAGAYATAQENLFCLTQMLDKSVFQFSIALNKMAAKTEDMYSLAVCRVKRFDREHVVATQVNAENERAVVLEALDNFVQLKAKLKRQAYETKVKEITLILKRERNQCQDCYQRYYHQSTKTHCGRVGVGRCKTCFYRKKAMAEDPFVCREKCGKCKLITSASKFGHTEFANIHYALEEDFRLTETFSPYLVNDIDEEFKRLLKLNIEPVGKRPSEEAETSGKKRFRLDEDKSLSDEIKKMVDNK